MKIKKIIDICKGTGHIILYDGEDEQQSYMDES